MLARTHLAVSIFFILLFFSRVEYKLAFVAVALTATLIPDIDSKFSKLGRKKLFRIVQFFLKHRGMLHSFSFLIAVTLLLALFFPIIALGFFLGYALHLFADSFTLEGIRPFYPLKRKVNGKMNSGSRTETLLFFLVIFVDVMLLSLLYFNGSLL